MSTFKRGDQGVTRAGTPYLILRADKGQLMQVQFGEEYGKQGIYWVHPSGTFDVDAAGPHDLQAPPPAA